MALIELRDATIRLLDGHTNTGLVNDVSISAGDTTLVVDGITGIIPDNAKMEIAGVEQTFQVTSTVGSPDTTQVTFTPALVTGDLPVDDAVITFGGRFIEVKIGEGNLSYTESRDLEYVLDKGNLDTVKENDQVPVDITFDFIWDNIKAISGGTPTVEDVLKQRGEASAWVSASADPCEPYATDLEVEHVPPCGGFQREFILLSDYRWDSLEHDLEGASVSSTGRCNVTEATITRKL